MNRLFDNFFASPFFLRGPALEQAGQAVSAPIELYETADDLLAYVYAPGLSAETLDISAAGDTITIQAEWKPLLEVTEGLTSHTPWSRQVTSSGTFSASYTLPVEVDPAKVQATYKDGVLHLRMPKSEAAKPRRVKVQVGQS